MSDSPEVAAARIEVERARERMMADVDALVGLAQSMQHKLAPSTLMRDAWEGAKGKGADLAEDAVDAVRSRPLATGGVVAALALFLAREPLMDLAGKLLGGDSIKSRKSKRAKAPKSPKAKASAAQSKDSDMEDIE